MDNAHLYIYERKINKIKKQINKEWIFGCIFIKCGGSSTVKLRLQTFV